MPKTLKISMTFKGDLATRFKELAQATGAESDRDVIKEALRLYEFVIAETLMGAKVVSRKNGRDTELICVGGVSKAAKKREEAQNGKILPFRVPPTIPDVKDG